MPQDANEAEKFRQQLVNFDEARQRLDDLTKSFDNLKIVGSGVSGNSRKGFCINCPPCEEPAVGGSSGIPIPSPTGACCIGPDCSIRTAAACASMGGTYQGDGTPCDPNPCTPEGACCRETVCTIETQESCESDGGVYQDDDSLCDPNPCQTGTPCDGCGYFNPVDGKYYLTKVITNIPTDFCPPGGQGACECTDLGSCIDADPPWQCTRWYFNGSCPTEYVSRLDCYVDEFGCHCPSESFPQCGDPGITCEDVNIAKYCESSCFGTGGGSCIENPDACTCIEPDCTVSFCCPPSCEAGSTSCTTVERIVSYENECIP